MLAEDLPHTRGVEEIVAAERLARSVIEEAAAAIVVCDTGERIVRASHAAEALCGCDPLRKEFSEAFPLVLPAEASRRRLRSLVAAALRGETSLRQPATLLRGERRIELLVSATGLHEKDRAIGCVVTMTDVTEQRRIEEALREADRRKNEFLAVLSHELRNPLAPIKNSLYLLQRVPPGGERAMRAQAVIERQVGQLARVVDDLLDLTRISRNKLELKRERLELNDLVGRTVEDYRSVFQQNGVQLHVKLAPAAVFVDADRARLQQVIGNLLHNAAKFTSRPGTATVSVAASRDGTEAIVRVSDTGAGIGPDLIDRLFEPFAQPERTVGRSQGGLGLGLALVKGMVEMHGGTVAARSAGPGKGATFTVHLPVAVAAEAVHPAPPVSVAHPPRRVLVIEDSLDTAESLRDVLELHHHEIAIATTGIEGLEKAHSFHPDVVLCDIGLPGMDGYEVARRMRADPALRRVRLIALSGYALPDDLERARQAGFSDHLAKPPPLDLLEQQLAAGPDPDPRRHA